MLICFDVDLFALVLSSSYFLRCAVSKVKSRSVEKVTSLNPAELLQELETTAPRIILGFPVSQSTILSDPFHALLPEISSTVYSGCRFILEYEFEWVMRWGVFEVLNFIMHGFLMLQLSFIAPKGRANPTWVGFGIFLEIYFWLDMMVRIIGLGELRYLR